MLQRYHNTHGFGRAVAALAAVVAVLFAGASAAHETDQYTLPRDRAFADVSDYFDAAHHRALERAVRILNEELRRATRIRDASERAARLAELHDPGRIADLAYSAFNDAFFEVLDIEISLRTEWASRAYPGQITAHWTADWIYTYTHFPLDPRRIALLFQSSTVKAYGVYFGTDKLSHFHHLGHMYFEHYRAELAAGKGEAEAVRSAIVQYTQGPISENGLVGYLATGVHSNGDLAANYTGMKFYRNLTEPVMLKGQLRQPLLLRIGDQYQLNVHVRPESGWFGWFVSDHWNEAFNPNLYDPMVRENVKGLMARRADDIIAFYTECDGRPDDPVYFDALAQVLSTYYGEDYGYDDGGGEVLTLGNTCYPARTGVRAGEITGASAAPPPSR